MEKMNKKDRITLIRALTKASNTFRAVLRECGYEVSYGGADLYQVGKIMRIDQKPTDTSYLGTLSIEWHIKDNIK